MAAIAEPRASRRRYNKVSFKPVASKIALLYIFIMLVILPLIRMLLNISSKSITEVINSLTFWPALANSVKVTSISTIITLIVAFILALSIERTGIKLKGIFGLIILMPMLIPSISHGMGLIILFGNNGIVNNFLNLKLNIYGMWGIVVGSVLYAFPVAFLMLKDIMKYEDSSPYEAAKVFGISKWRQFTGITLPYLRKPLISVIFATFTIIVTDYGVPLMVGGKFNTIPVIMYQEVIGQLNFGRGSVYGAILLLPAIIAFVFDLANKDKGNSVYVIKRFTPQKNPIRDAAAYIYCTAISLFTLLPIISFIILGFTKKYPRDLSVTINNIAKVSNLNGGKYLFNSIIIALSVAIIGIIISFVTAYITARMKSRFSKLLHLIAITSMAIPGIVLGLSYVLMFKGTMIYGTIIILIMVNLIHFVATPYLMLYNSLSKLNDNLESVGETLGISRFHMLRDVFIPQSKDTLLEMFAYFFVNSMMTISAVSFLSNTKNKPISLMINQFEAQMQLENAAIVSLAILLVNVAIKGLIYILKKSRRRI